MRGETFLANFVLVFVQERKPKLFGIKRTPVYWNLKGNRSSEIEVKLFYYLSLEDIGTEEEKKVGNWLTPDRKKKEVLPKRFPF